jgi:hydroxypyruvate reductase
MRNEPGPDCLISGGEPTVKLVAESTRGKGGRNQQLALAALTTIADCEGIALLSAGTDGEDGPTDAAGALVTAAIVERAEKLHLDPRDYLQRNDAYSFFAATEGLLKTGPTQTNVCDLRVVVTSGPTR